MWTTEAKEVKRKRDFTCDGCGGMFPAWELDVHHRDYSHPNREGCPEDMPTGWFPPREQLDCPEELTCLARTTTTGNVGLYFNALASILTSFSNQGDCSVVQAA